MSSTPDHETTIMIHCNGTSREIPEGWTLAQLLADLGMDSRQLAVEVNAEVVPRDGHATTTLQPGDRLEIVTLVGGG